MSGGGARPMPDMADGSLPSRNAHLIAFMDAITTCGTDALPRLAQRACAAGASRDELRTAVEISPFLIDLPAPVLARAHAVVSAPDSGRSGGERPHRPDRFAAALRRPLKGGGRGLPLRAVIAGIREARSCRLLMGSGITENAPRVRERGGSTMPGKGPVVRRTALTLLVGALALLGAAQARAGALEAAKERGTLIVGVRDDFPPLGYLDADGRPAGFEVDLARYMAQQLLGDEGKLRLVRVVPGHRITSLLAESADMLIAAVTATEDRTAVFAFSEPYFISGSLLLVPRNSAIKGVRDLKDKKVAVIEGSIQEGGLNRVVPEAVPVKFWRVSDAMEALRTGKVDALAEDDILVVALARQNPDLAAVGEPFRPRPYAVAMRKGDPDLLAWVNDQLRKAKADSTYDTLWNRYFGEAGAILLRPR